MRPVNAPRYTPPMNATRLFTIAFALALLSGCGNKGPLVLPPRPAPIDPATVPDAPAETAPAETPATEPAVDGTTPPATEPVQDGTTPTTEPLENGTTPPAEVPAVTPPATDGDGNG